MIMRRDILIRPVATWGRHAASLGEGGREGLVTIAPPSGSLTGESLAAFLRGNEFNLHRKLPLDLQCEIHPPHYKKHMGGCE